MQGGKLRFLLDNNCHITLKYACSSSELDGIPQVPDEIMDVEN